MWVKTMSVADLTDEDVNYKDEYEEKDRGENSAELRNVAGDDPNGQGEYEEDDVFDEYEKIQKSGRSNEWGTRLGGGHGKDE